MYYEIKWAAVTLLNLIYASLSTVGRCNHAKTVDAATPLERAL